MAWQSTRYLAAHGEMEGAEWRCAETGRDCFVVVLVAYARITTLTIIRGS